MDISNRPFVERNEVAIDEQKAQSRWERAKAAGRTAINLVGGIVEVIREPGALSAGLGIDTFRPNDSIAVRNDVHCADEAEPEPAS